MYQTWRFNLKTDWIWPTIFIITISGWTWTQNRNYFWKSDYDVVKGIIEITHVMDIKIERNSTFHAEVKTSKCNFENAVNFSHYEWAVQRIHALQLFRVQTLDMTIMLLYVHIFYLAVSCIVMLLPDVYMISCFNRHNWAANQEIIKQKLSW